MRRNPLLISAGVLVVTVSAVIAVRYLHTYESSAQAGAPSAAVGSDGGNTSDGDNPDADSSPGATPDIAGDPALKQRFEVAGAMVAAAKGMSVIVRDRKSGGEWRSGETTHPSWTSSTIKLAMAVNLLERNRTGEIKLDTAARKQIAEMLDTSADAAADALWDKYGGEGFVVWFQQQYGMAGLTFPPGTPHRWGSLKGTTEDLVRLVTYVLDRADPADRDYLVAAMRRPGTVQQWGVWAAGGAQQPGVGNGWALEVDGGARHFVTHSVGFAGPDAQYAVAVMYDLPAGAKIDTGVHAVSDVIATLFGAPTPAPVKVPPAAPAGRKK
jgi:hypothetical protein